MMGHKLSVVRGVKSENYYEPGNAINEIWLGDVEVISRLPFGDTDMAQAGWPEGGLPKIPWHNFIIPLKRTAKRWAGAANPRNTQVTKNERKQNSLIAIDDDQLYTVCTGLFPMFILFILALSVLDIPVTIRRHTPPYQPGSLYPLKTAEQYRRRAKTATLALLVGTAMAGLDLGFWTAMQQECLHSSTLYLVVDALFTCMGFVVVYVSAKATVSLWIDVRKVKNNLNPEHTHESKIYVGGGVLGDYEPWVELHQA